MSNLERNTTILSKYIPEHAVPFIADWIVVYDIKLKIKKERASKLGDYRAPTKGTNHIITINHNLNPYSFLITLVHEIAHLTTFNKHRDNVFPHGEEWKQEFRILMKHLLHPHIFPTEILYVLARYMHNPAAASCSDHNLLRMLKKYDLEKQGGYVFLENIPFRSVFKYRDNRLFLKGEKIRTRFRCKEIASGHYYLFNPLTEVLLFEKEETETTQ